MASSNFCLGERDVSDTSWSQDLEGKKNKRKKKKKKVFSHIQT